MKEKKIPIRKCVITNNQHPKNEMIRVVRDQFGQVVIDLTGKVRGHGAYLTKDPAVILLAQKKKTLNRVLEVEVDEQIYLDLYELVSK